MLDTQNYLLLVRRRGEAGLELSRVYRNMRRKELFLLAYSNLYANKGATTPGIDSQDTIDGMSLERIEAVIDQLAKGTYTWTPVRRAYIEKKHSSKMRPLGIPGWNDKMVQEVTRLILESYYEPQFRDCSHGFRPKRGCHTALQDVYRTWRGTKWFIELDIKGCFDNISHQVLLEILQRKINDDRFLKLLRDMLKAGYMENWRYHNTYSGTPQGGIVSPVLANIVLNELDIFVEDTLIPEYTAGKRRQGNPEYGRLNQMTFRAKKNGDRKTYKDCLKKKKGAPKSPDTRPHVYTPAIRPVRR
jgi:group II intron reverse transcriptase/maturase